MSDENGFGYVEIKDGLIVCYTGNQSNPTIHKFENDKIINSVIIVEQIKKIRDKHLKSGEKDKPIEYKSLKWEIESALNNTQEKS